MPRACAKGTSVATQPLRLLIVDDRVMQRKLLRRALEAEGQKVVEASDGHEALTLLAGGTIDAVVADVLMPGLDGLSLCLEIRNSAAGFAQVPIVLYSDNYCAESDRSRAESAGADCFVTQPAAVTVVMAAIRKAMCRSATDSRRAPRDHVAILRTHAASLIDKLAARDGQLAEALANVQTAHEQVASLSATLESRVALRTAVLQAANAELEAFAGTVAHDLRTPLASIEGYAGLLRDSTAPALDATDRECLAQISTAAIRMNALIDSLLQFARSGSAPLVLAATNLENCLDEALITLAHEINGRNIEWRRRRLPRVCVDRTLLRQVLINLISNALKYTRARDLAVIEIGARPGRAEEVIVYVSDNGVGFEAQAATELFEPFKRFHGHTGVEGVGMGLASVRRIIARHGGSVWSESTLGQGATFYFSLPAVAGGA